MIKLFGFYNKFFIVLDFYSSFFVFFFGDFSVFSGNVLDVGFFFGISSMILYLMNFDFDSLFDDVILEVVFSIFIVVLRGNEVKYLVFSVVKL